MNPYEIPNLIEWITIWLLICFWVVIRSERKLPQNPQHDGKQIKLKMWTKRRGWYFE